MAFRFRPHTGQSRQRNHNAREEESETHNRYYFNDGMKTFSSVLCIRIHWIRIWIQNFKLIRIQSGPRVLMTKKWRKKIQLEFFYIFFDQKLQFNYVQATGEAFGPQNRTSCTSKKFINFFLCLRSSFALLVPDPDCEFGSGDWGTPLHPGPIQIQIRIHNTAFPHTTNIRLGLFQSPEAGVSVPEFGRLSLQPAKFRDLNSGFWQRLGVFSSRIPAGIAEGFHEDLAQLLLVLRLLVLVLPVLQQHVNLTDNFNSFKIHL